MIFMFVQLICLFDFCLGGGGVLIRGQNLWCGFRVILK